MTICGIEWRASFSGLEVSRCGKIRSAKSGRILKPWAHRSGHLYVRSSKQMGKSLQVHRLVALAFIGDCPENMECCHKDGNPMNNHVDNLEWGCRSKNIRDYIAKHNKHWRAAITYDIAEQIRAEYSGVHGSQSALARKYGVSRFVISDLVAGKTYKSLVQQS